MKGAKEEVAPGSVLESVVKAVARRGREISVV